MFLPQPIKSILKNYESDSPAIKAKLAHLLMTGKLGGTGKMIILPVDQGFEHGPGRSFGMNPAAYDPHYHFRLAIEAGVNAYAGPLGWLEAGADTFAGEVPLILKMNSNNALMSPELPANQAITSSIEDALYLGCTAVGFTIYPGSDDCLGMFEEIRELIAEAKSVGLPVIIWSYPRGNMSKEGETALDVVAYGAHMAALLGAHVIKVKLPSDHLEMKEAKKVYESQNIPLNPLSARVKHIVESCFNGRRMVVFSGGEATDVDEVYKDAKAIRDGGANGSIIGRNCFKRPWDEALAMLQKLVSIYSETV